MGKINPEGKDKGNDGWKLPNVLPSEIVIAKNKKLEEELETLDASIIKIRREHENLLRTLETEKQSLAISKEKEIAETEETALLEAEEDALRYQVKEMDMNAKNIMSDIKEDNKELQAMCHLRSEMVADMHAKFQHHDSPENLLESQEAVAKAEELKKQISETEKATQKLQSRNSEIISSRQLINLEQAVIMVESAEDDLKWMQSKVKYFKQFS